MQCLGLFKHELKMKVIFSKMETMSEKLDLLTCVSRRESGQVLRILRLFSPRYHVNLM